MAEYHWKGVDTVWSNTANWVTTVNGSTLCVTVDGIGFPNYLNNGHDLFFDSTSSGNCTVAGNDTEIRRLVITSAYTGTITFNHGGNFKVRGTGSMSGPYSIDVQGDVIGVTIVAQGNPIEFGAFAGTCGRVNIANTNGFPVKALNISGAIEYSGTKISAGGITIFAPVTMLANSYIVTTRILSNNFGTTPSLLIKNTAVLRFDNTISGGTANTNLFGLHASTTVTSEVGGVIMIGLTNRLTMIDFTGASGTFSLAGTVSVVTAGTYHLNFSRSITIGKLETLVAATIQMLATTGTLTVTTLSLTSGTTIRSSDYATAGYANATLSVASGDIENAGIIIREITAAATSAKYYTGAGSSFYVQNTLTTTNADGWIYGKKPLGNALMFGTMF